MVDVQIKQFSNEIIQRLITTHKFDSENIVNQILNTGIPITSYFSDLYFYMDGYWRKHKDIDIERKIFVKEAIRKITGKRPNVSQIETIHRELLTEYIDMPETSEILINFKDNILKINNGNYETILHNPEYRKLYKLDFAYDPSAICPKTDDFLMEVIEEQEAIDMLWEFIGSCFISNDFFKLEKTIFLHGTGSNGKSVFLDLLRQLFGTMNISTVSLKDMATPERRHAMIGKLLNIAAEGSANKFDSEDFKAIVTREPLPVRQLYDNAIETSDFPRLIFATNNLPYTGGDTSHGISRRIDIITFDKTISEDKQDKQLLQKLIPELPGVMNRVLEGMLRLLRNQNLTKSPKVEKAKERYEMQLDPVKYFVHEVGFVVDDEAPIYDTKALYPEFQMFCKESGINALNKRNFTAGINTIFGAQKHSNMIYGWRIRKKDTVIKKIPSPYEK